MEPNLLYTLKNKLDAFQIYWQQEVDDFAKVFFKPAEKQREADKGLLNACVDPSVGHSKASRKSVRSIFGTSWGHSFGCTRSSHNSWRSRMWNWRSFTPMGDS